MKIIFNVCILLAVSSGYYCYKILVYSPIFGYSQQKFMGSIADTLTKNGHDVTMLMPVLDDIYKNSPGVVLTKKMIFVDADEKIKDQSDHENAETYSRIWTTKLDTFALRDINKGMIDLFIYTCSRLVQNEELLGQLREEKFDLGISEVFQFCGFGIFEVLGINKTIAASSPTLFEHYSMYIGEPLAPSYVPALTSSYSDKMTLLQRLENSLNSYLEGGFIDMFNGEYEALKKFHPTTRSVEELMNQVSIMFINSNPYLNFPRPILQKTIEIGGITVKHEPHKKLSPEIEHILAQRKQTVYISFGSVVKSKDMPMDYKIALLEVMAKMPNVTFIWKYEEPCDMADHLSNVHLMSWLPQNDLLADERVTLFVTHGGIGSVTETAYQGKPAIVIALFAEQPRNGQMLARHGGALLIDKRDLNKPHIIESAFTKILNDKRFEQNAHRLAKVLQEKPTSNEELILKYTEFVAKFGPLTQLDNHGRHLSFIQYHYIDAIALIFSLVAIFTYLVLCALRNLCRNMRSKAKVE